MRPGKVYLVGAGPGHPDLLTVKAHRLIGRADVIVYDRLVQTECLAHARKSAELIYMGKSPGRHKSRRMLHSSRRQCESNYLLYTIRIYRTHGGEI